MNKQEYMKEYYQKNKERIRENMKRYQKRNRQKINEKSRAYYYQHRDSILERKRELYKQKKSEIDMIGRITEIIRWSFNEYLYRDIDDNEMLFLVNCIETEKKERIDKFDKLMDSVEKDYSIEINHKYEYNKKQIINYIITISI